MHLFNFLPPQCVSGGKEDTFQLFCCIYEATLIDRKTAKKPIRFEMNIGNYGNTIDGKLVSWKEDDDEDEDEEDKFVRPLTDPMEVCIYTTSSSLSILPSVHILTAFNRLSY